MISFDTIIIGGGLGGLVAGAKLSKEGEKVLLIEQHSVAGGCATTFKRKDFIVEAGLHAIDGLDEKDPKRSVFEDLKVFENVEFIKVPEFYRFKNGKYDFVVPNNIDEAIKVLVEKFPDEKKGISKYFKRIQSIRTETSKFLFDKRKLIFLFPLFPFIYPNLVKNAHQTIGKFLDSIIKNEDLKIILQANLLYYHDDPYTMSIIYFSAGQASYFLGGGCYIKGGSQKLSDYLVSIIKKNGGEVLTQNLVTKIITKNNEAIGVEYKNKEDKTSEIKTVFSRNVISNASIPDVGKLLSSESKILIQKSIENLEKSCSLLSIYVGFKREIKELGSLNYSTIMVDDSVKSLKDINANYKGSFENKSFVFVDYSTIDSRLAPKGKSSGVFCTIDYTSDWEKYTKDEYKNKKDEVAKIFFRKLENILPGITDEIEYYEVGTSKTIERFTLNSGGSVYGYAQTPKQAGMYRIKNISAIKNLYFASAWTNPGGGFTGAILSGWFCANQVLKSK